MSTAIITRTVRGPFALAWRIWRRLCIRMQLQWLADDCEPLRRDIRDNTERLRIKQASIKALHNERARLKG